MNICELSEYDNAEYKDKMYKVYWCDELLTKIEEIAKEKYPNTSYWADTGSRLNVALAILEQFRMDLKVRKL